MDGTGMSRMRLIVPAASSIRVLSDLKDNELTLTSPGFQQRLQGGAGFLLKSDFDLLPGRDFTIRYSAGRAIDRRIVEKRFQVAAVSDDMLGRALAIIQNQSGAIPDRSTSRKIPDGRFGVTLTTEARAGSESARGPDDVRLESHALVERLGSAGGTKFVSGELQERLGDSSADR